ncbi:MAG: WD40 repeat domain-containing protein [Gemmataceae bacterium]
MIVLDAGARVTQLRFLPDGRLLVGTWAAGDAELLILPLPSGPRVVIPLSVRQVWDEPNRVAVSPAGDRLYTTFGALQTLSTADGAVIPDGPSGPASQVVVSPDGQHLISTYRETNGDTELTEHAADGQRVRHATYPHPQWKVLVGFLVGGNRYALVGNNELLVERSNTGPGPEPVRVRYPSYHVNQPQVSPDGRHFGVIGYSSFYLYDAAAPGKPRQIKGGQSFGNFVGFAFHPAGRTLAVIHGGPTLVKLYDLDTLTLRTKLNWKVGKLTCVGYSPDGQLAAVGTEDGRVVVWDADE